MAGLIVDGVLIAGLWALALGCLFSDSARRAVQLFIAFALLLSLSWLRLQSPLVALAELLLGAVLTGMLLMITLRRLEWTHHQEK